jgi:hypothetical protein
VGLSTVTVDHPHFCSEYIILSHCLVVRNIKYLLHVLLTVQFQMITIFIDDTHIQDKLAHHLMDIPIVDNSDGVMNGGYNLQEAIVEHG